MRFIWDAAKAAANKRKHRTSFTEAVSVFADELALIVGDELQPERAILIGLASSGRILVTVYVEQADDVIRIISARLATSHERKRYEEGEP
jgi:uncharacterized DUF497 family protein